MFFKRRKDKSVDVKVIKNLIGKANLIDIREPFEYKAGHIPSTKNIPMEELQLHPELYLDKNKEYYLICETGRRSLITTNDLLKKGYKVINVDGGTSRYQGKLDK